MASKRKSAASKPAPPATPVLVVQVAPPNAGLAKDDLLQLKRIERGLKLLTVPMPYLAGLAAALRFSLDDRIPTMGVFASGRMSANPRFAAKLKDDELIFVLAHELLHLALRTHDRARGSHHLEFNYAHDYIINDILRHELGFTTAPAGGLDMPGARDKGAEEIVLEMRRNADTMKSKSQVFDGEETTVGKALGKGRTKPGEGQGEPDNGGDVLDDKREREMFPGDTDNQKADAEKLREAAEKALALAKAIGAMKGMRGLGGGGETEIVTALRGLYGTPWQIVLQRWLESVAPGERTFNRPSRRQVEHADVVLPGRRRQGWILNIVLDTSGSMNEEIPRALGAIADFCDAVAVDQVRLLQCDTDITADDCVAPMDLARYQVTGYGGSDLSPAMLRLAEDPQIRAAAIITDGDIAYPTGRMPYDVLWVLPPGASPGFQPPYGRVVRMQQG
jgi:predicted metal-dependent peptidase